MSNLAYSIIYPQPRKLTLGLVLALSLFSLTVNAQTVVRYNSNGEKTASGDDIGEVQTTTGAAEGDVIKVSDGAAFNTDVIDPVSGFTIESATGNVVNVPVQARYNFPQIPAAPVNATFRNVSFTGAENYNSSFWRGDLNKDNIIGITIDGNVSFSNFRDSVFHYYQTDTENEYFPYKFTCTSGSTLTFSGNTANWYGTANVGGAIRQLSELNGNGSFMTFTGNTARNGGAIGDLSDLSGSGNILEFSENTANVGGAISTLSDVTGNNNTLKFSGNTAAGNRGGAIYAFEKLSGSGNTLTFSGNTAEYDGGAIYKLASLSGSGNTLTFSNNTANGTGDIVFRTGGGAIERLGYLSGSGNTLEFSENTAAKTGGAIFELINLSGSGNTLTFTGNTAGKHGGAITCLHYLSGSGNTLTFSGNTAAIDGGAIRELRNFSGSGNTLIFTGNKAVRNGGAIAYFRGLRSNNNKLTFTGNTARNYGGAIYTTQSITFSGNNTLTFTGNKAGTKGNDIYLEGYYSPANLSFNGGTYSFDGGIWIDKDTSGQYGKTTISNGANVTIAGRNDDSVNEYEFRDVALNANLTATVDDIEYLHGNFTVGENGLLTINKGSDTATIKSSTNGGVLDLVYNSEVETISISSGRIDIKGYMDASIELQNDAELQSVASFSPGNSAGRLETTGDFIATAGSLLIFEQEGDVYDQLIANNVTIDPETGIDLSQFTTFAPGAVYDIIIANGTLSVDQSWIDMIQSGLPEFVEASIYNGNTVRLKIDANAVPEPSTWALLILGAAGLAYWRKRK